MPLKLRPPRKGKTPYYAVCGTYLGVRVDRSTKTSKRAIAAKILHKIEREIECGSFSVKGELTFAAAAASYMKAGGERTYLRKLLEHFGDKPLSQIDQNATDAAAVTLYPSATAATRNRQVYTPVSAVIRHSGRTGNLKRPRGHVGNLATAWPWPEQAHALFAEAEKLDKEFAALLIVLTYTGMRLSEALGLTWDNVRLADGYAYLPDTKNDNPRAVFLPPMAVAAMGNIREDTGGRVFRFAKSGHLYQLLKCAAFRASVDLPERSAFHILRHTYATWMRRYAGADETTLIATGAWKDKKSVSRYTHAVVSEEARLAERLPTPGRKAG